MDVPQSELEAIRQALAELTTRVYRMEQRLQLAAPAPAPPPARAEPAAVDAPVVQRQAPPPLIPPRPAIAPTRKAQPDRESRIGSHWLNRIGIAALLIGVSYFLKFAFDNNWIGPAGRISIGLIAGIAIVIWSEGFRRQGLQSIFIFTESCWHRHAVFLARAAFHLYSLIPEQRGFRHDAGRDRGYFSDGAEPGRPDSRGVRAVGGFSTPILLSTGETAKSLCSPTSRSSISLPWCWWRSGRGAACW